MQGDLGADFYKGKEEKEDLGALFSGVKSLIKGLDTTTK